MPDLPQLSLQFGGPHGGVDTSKQMLGVLDNLSTSFRSALQSAQGKEREEAHLASGDSEGVQEEGSDASVEEVEKEGSSEGEELVEEAHADEAEVEVASVDDSVAESTEVLIEEEVSQEVHSQEEVSSEVQVVDEQVEEQDESLSVSEASVSVQQEAEPVQEELVTSPLKQEIAAKQEVSTEEAVDSVTDESEKGGKGERRPSEPLQNKQKLPQSSLGEMAAQQEELENSPELDIAEINDAEALESQALDTEDFHSIDSESAEGEIFLPKEEVAQMKQALAQVAAQTQVQSPQAEKISSRLLEGLKAVNHELAQSLEGKAKSQASTQAPQAKIAPAPNQGVAQKSSIKPEVLDKPTEAQLEQRLEQLKSKVIEQVRFRLKMAMDGKVGKVQMKLNPQFLGNVQISLSMEDSALTAQFVVDSQTVKDLLTRNAPNLQQALNEQGLQLEDVEVNVAGDQMQDGGSGKGFASTEEQKAVREWLGSFYHADGGEDIPQAEVELPPQEESVSTDQSLNVVA